MSLYFVLEIMKKKRTIVYSFVHLVLGFIIHSHLEKNVLQNKHVF